MELDEQEPVGTLDEQAPVSATLDEQPPVKIDQSNARSANRWRIGADVIGALSDYLVNPLSKMNPVTLPMRAVDTFTKATGLTPMNRPFPGDSETPLLNLDGVDLKPALHSLGYLNDNDAIDQAILGTGDFAKNLTEGLTSPKMLSDMAVGKMGPTGAKAIKAYFESTMAAHAPEAAAQFGTAAGNGDVRGATSSLLNYGMGTVLPAVTIKGSFKGNPVLTDVAEPERAQKTEVSDAAPIVSEFGDIPLDEQAPVQTSEPVPMAASAEALPSAPNVPTMLPSPQFPVVEVPLKDLSLSQDVPNFKADANAKTGVVEGQELQGRYERLGTGAITVYERANGDMEVISGRHRFDLAKRTGEETIPSQVVREADGFTPKMAQVLDAEMNIRDGQGTVGDYADYFRNTEITPEQAQARGLVSRAKGQAGWEIGKNASEDLYALFRAGKINEGQTAAIASAAPGDAGLQRVGSVAALDGAGPLEIKNFVQAVKLETKGMTPEQFDLFGENDAALNTARQLAGVASRIQGELSREIKATDNAAKSATTARAKGIQFDRPPEEILADNMKMRGEMERWNNWSLHPDLVAQVRGYAEMGRTNKQGVIRGSKVEKWADDVIKRKGATSGAMNSPGPDLLAAYGVKAAALLERGIVDTAQWIKELGEQARPHLEVIAARAKEIIASSKVPIPRLTGKELGDYSNWSELREKAREIARQISGQKVITKQGAPVEFNWQGLKHTTRDGASEAELITVAALPQMLRRADYLGHESDRHARNTILAIHKFETPVVIGDKSYKATMVVRETTSGTFFYDHTVLEENSPAGISGEQGSLDSHQPATGPVGSESKEGVNPNPAFPPSSSGIQSEVRTKPENSNAQNDAKVNTTMAADPQRQRVLKILADAQASPTVKAAVAMDAPYEVRSLSVPTAEANAIISKVGADAAVELFKDARSLLPLDTRTALGALLQDHFRDQERLARGMGNQALADAMAGKQVELWKADGYGTELAQGLNARKLYDKMSAGGMLRHAKELFGEAGEKAWQEIKPTVDGIKQTLRQSNEQAIEQLRTDREVNRAAAAAVDEAVEKSPATHKAVIMELAEPFAQSPTILTAAREAVRSKANELLNKAPRPAGLSASAQLRGILDGLAQRAASIAASHYQGAEPGVILRDKLMQRLGLGQEQAARLAKSLDGQFARMVETAKAKISQRIATQRAKQVEANYPIDLTKPIPEAALGTTAKSLAERIVLSLETEAESARKRLAGKFLSPTPQDFADLAVIGASHIARGTLEFSRWSQAMLQELGPKLEPYLQRIWMDSNQAVDARVAGAGKQMAPRVKKALTELNDKQVDQAIRQQLRETKVKLGQLLREHSSTVDTTGKNLAERVVQASGLTGEKAEALREVFQRRFEAIVTARKRAALEQLAKSPARPPRAVRTASEKLIQLTNLGAFEDSKFYDLVKKNLDLPVLTDELAREIAKRANDLQKIPEGNLRDRAAGDLMNYIARQKGLSVADKAMGIFYSNILSGLTTPAKIILENANLLASNTIAGALARPGDVFRDPMGYVQSLSSAWARGIGKGGLQAESTLRTGVVTGVWKEPRSTIMELKPFGERLEPLNFWKYFGRTIGTAHELTFKPAWEIKQTLIARDVARKEGLKGPALNQRVADLLGNTEERVNAAKSQAYGELQQMGAFTPRRKGESLMEFARRQLAEKADYRRRVGEIIEKQREINMPGSTEVARDYALRSAYINEPYGFLGMIADGVRTVIERSRKEFPVLGSAAKTQVPFTTIAANILNEKLNWTPVGTVRAGLSLKSGKLYGREVMPTDRADLLAKSIVGTILLGTAAELFGQHIHGNGPSDPNKRKQLQASGWIPNSIEVNGHFHSYMHTPLGMGLAIIGNYLDWQRYGKGSDADGLTRAAFVTKATANAILSQSVLDSLRRFLEAMGTQSTTEGADRIEKLLARTASSFVVPNLAQQLDRFWDPNIYDSTDMESLLKAQIPFVRRDNRPALNVLGDPVESGPFHLWASKANPDPLWQTLVQHQAWVPEVPKTVMIGDKKRGPDYYRALTPDERYDYVQETGQKIREQLERSLDRLANMESDQAKAFVRNIAEAERTKVKAKLR